MKPSAKKSGNLTTAILLFLLTAQFLVWNGVSFYKKDVKKTYFSGIRDIKPELEIVPNVPSKEILKAISFGDEQLTFRYNGYMMQFIGDTFGRVTPLKDYNYEKLYRWWLLLDDIDSESNLITYVVGYYWSATQNPERDIPYVVNFLEQHADKHPSEKWWWYSQAAYNAKFKMHDSERALEIAKKLADLPKDLDIPIWTRQLQAFFYEDKGEYKQACDIILNVIQDFGDDKISQGEMNFMYSFIQERLRTMINKGPGLDNADISPECRAMMEVQKAQDLKKFYKK